MVLELLKAFVFGVIEGITEWLPVSSTGHLILLDEFVSLNAAPELGAAFADEYMSMFEVVIQLGAILAVVFLYFGKLNPFAPSKSRPEKKSTWVLWLKVLIASLPAAFVGLVADKLLEKATGKDIDGWIYNAVTVSLALIVYGILFILVERFYKPKKNEIVSIDDIGYGQALFVGIFQMLSIVPGTSRSGSTILGARFLGISRPAAAEFSFFMGIPAMAGASLIKGYGFFEFVGQNNIQVPALSWVVLAFACVTAFAVSMVAIKFLMEFVKKHSFAPFGVYRIILGVLVLGYFLIVK